MTNSGERCAVLHAVDDRDERVVVSIGHPLRQVVSSASAAPVGKTDGAEVRTRGG
jgi:hypothetical protein